MKKHRDEIEITAEMIQAGVIAYEHFSESYASAELVAAVYTAMALASAESATRLKTDLG